MARLRLPESDLSIGHPTVQTSKRPSIQLLDQKLFQSTWPPTGIFTPRVLTLYAILDFSSCHGFQFHVTGFDFASLISILRHGVCFCNTVWFSDTDFSFVPRSRIFHYGVHFCVTEFVSAKRSVFLRHGVYFCNTKFGFPRRSLVQFCGTELVFQHWAFGVCGTVVVVLRFRFASLLCPTDYQIL